MKVFHVVNSLDPASGGLPAVVARLAAAQSRFGINASVLTYSHCCAEADVERLLAGIPGIDNVRIVGVGSRGYFEGITGRRACRRIEGILSPGDIVHLHGVWDSILRAGARAAVRRGAHYVVAPHGMLDPWSLNQKRLKKQLALALQSRTMLDRALFIHVLNEQEQLLARPLGLAAPFEVFPNAVFAEELQALPGRGSFAARCPELAGKPYILFLGRLHHKKGLDVLVEAFDYVARRDAEVQLVVAGPDDGARPGFERDVAARGIRHRVHLTGPLYGPDKLAAYADAAVFCLPSRAEGFSMAVIEALGCGLPVVISRQCHFPEVEDAGAGKITDLEPVQVGKALLDLLADPAQLQETGERGKRLIMSHYAWPGIARRMIDAYQRRRGKASP